MTAIINIRRVSKSFGGVVANHDVSMKVEKGTITGLIGPNGSGKSFRHMKLVQRDDPPHFRFHPK